MVNGRSKYRIKDIFDLSAGGDVDKEHFSVYKTSECRYPIYSNSLENHGLYGYTSNPKYNADSVTITGRGSVGHAEYREDKFDAIIRLLVLEPKSNNVCAQFVADYINNCVEFPLESTGVPQLTAPQIMNIELELPQYGEQKEIAALLADVDSLIDALNKQVHKKKAIKQGVMQELLTGKKRLPGFSGEWQHSCLGESVELSTTTISSKLIDSRYYVGTDNMVADRGGVKDNELSLTYANVREYKAGDVLLSNIRPYLKKIWYATRDGGCSNDVLVIRRKNSEELDSGLLYYILATDAFFDEIMAYAVGTKMPRGDKSVIKSYKICFPKEISEQQAIAEILSNMDLEIEALEQKLEKYRQVKQGMMQQLLTGKIRLV